MKKKELIKENEELKSHLDILDKAILNKDNKPYSIENFNEKEVEVLDELLFDRTDERMGWLLTQYKEYFGTNYAFHLKVELKWLLSTMSCEYRNALKEELLEETEQLEEQITTLKSDIEEITRCPYEYFKKNPKQFPNEPSDDVKLKKLVSTTHTEYRTEYFVRWKDGITKRNLFEMSVEEIEAYGKQVRKQLVAKLNKLENRNKNEEIIKELGL